jgi:hypothetical protein
MNWDKDKSLKAYIYYHYPVACREMLKVICDNYQISNLAVKEHKSGGHSGTAYFAAILDKP